MASNRLYRPKKEKLTITGLTKSIDGENTRQGRSHDRMSAFPELKTTNLKTAHSGYLVLAHT